MPGLRGTREYELLNVPVDAKLRCTSHRGDAFGFRVTTARRSGVQGSDLQGLWQAGSNGRIELKGKFSTMNAPVFDNAWDISDLAAVINYDANTIAIDELKMRLGDKTNISLNGRITDYKSHPSFKVHASIYNLYHSPEAVPNAFVYSQSLLANISAPIVKRWLNEYKPRGRVDLDVNAAGEFSEIKKATCQGVLVCRDVTVTYQAFPYAIEHIAGRIGFTEQTLSLDNLKARHNATEFVISGHSKGRGPEWDADFHVISPEVVLNDDIYKALNVKQKNTWFVLSPNGKVGVDYHFRGIPGVGRKGSMRIYLLDVSTIYLNFPYPLKHLTGVIEADRDSVKLENVTARYSGREVIINGCGFDPNHPRYDFSISAHNMPVDSQLCGALPDKYRNFGKHFDMSGFVDAKARVFKSSSEPNANYDAAIVIHDASLEYDKLPMAFTDIRGDVRVTPDQIDLKNVQAWSGRTRVDVSGLLRPVRPEKDIMRYNVKVDVNDLEIDDTCLSIVPASVADFIRQMHPQGKIRLIANLDNTISPNHPKFGAVVECMGNAISYSEIPLSIEKYSRQG